MSARPPGPFSSFAYRSNVPLISFFFLKENWDIYSYYINSTVSSRYAVTVITSRVANRMEESKEIEFHVRIPKNAFISKFKMYVRQRCINTAILVNSGNLFFFFFWKDLHKYDLFHLRVIEGQEYDGVVKEKEKAQQQYSHAVSRGQSAGIVRYISHLFHFLMQIFFDHYRDGEKISLLAFFFFLRSSVGRTLEEFKTSVTVAAHQKVTFELTYEELLKRRLGKYELQIHARPMQPVKDFKVRPLR